VTLAYVGDKKDVCNSRSEEVAQVSVLAMASVLLLAPLIVVFPSMQMN
jgi:hypothetical protein